MLKVLLSIRPGVSKHWAAVRPVKKLFLGRAEPRPNWSKSDWNDWYKEHTAGAIDYHNPSRSEHCAAERQAQISYSISAMMTYELQYISMCQTFIILLKVGSQNNARLKAVRSAKKFAYPWIRSNYVS